MQIAIGKLYGCIPALRERRIGTVRRVFEGAVAEGYDGGTCHRDGNLAADIGADKPDAHAVFDFNRSVKNLHAGEDFTYV